MYESKTQAPIHPKHFVARLLIHTAIACGVLVGSLVLGIAGYMGFEQLSLVDAFLNSAMLLGGMGPVNLPQTTPGKIFAGLYALYAGLVFIATAALIFAPLLHRIMHKFHWDTD